MILHQKSMTRNCRFGLSFFIPLSVVAMLIVFHFSACKKDAIPAITTSSLSVEEARKFFTEHQPSGANGAVLRSDTLEILLSEPPAVPDWENAEVYFDESKQQSVVEVPLLEDAFSRYLINPEIDNVVVDTALFMSSLAKNRLIVVRDTSGATDYAIMKITGTYDYQLTRAGAASNSYQQIDSLFEGTVEYVDIYDHVRQSYYVVNNQYHEIDSVNTEGFQHVGAQDRWELICITVYYIIPCPCQGHFPGDHCTCSSQPRMVEYQICYPSTVIGEENTSGWVPPINPNSDWGSGGSGSGTPGSGLSCYMENVNAFNAEYGTNLLEVPTQEDIALECNQGCGEEEAALFEACVNEQLTKITLVPLGFTPDQITWVQEKQMIGVIISLLESTNNSAPYIQALKDVIDARIGNPAPLTTENMLKLVGIQTNLNLVKEKLQWLIGNPAVLTTVHDFLNAHPGSPSAVNIAKIVTDHALNFVVMEDLALLLENPDLYIPYNQYLEQNPDATQEDKATLLRLVVIPDNNSIPIPDLNQRLNCFNKTSNSSFLHSVTLFVDQPVANTSIPASGNDKAGHTWIMVKQDQGNGNVIQLNVGFYPDGLATPWNQVHPGVWKDDMNHAYDVSVTWPLTPSHFNALVQELSGESSPSNYDLSNYNCTTAAVNNLNAQVVGLNVPSTSVESFENYTFPQLNVVGLNPAQLGQDLRNYNLPSGATRNVTGGLSLPSTCQ